MVVGFCEGGLDNGHAVHVFTEIRKDLGHHFAALTAGSEFKGGLHEVTDGIFEEAGGIAEAGIEFADGFAVPAREFGAVVPCVHGAGAAVDEDPDDAFSASGEVGGLGGERVEGAVTEAVGGGGGIEETFVVEESGESEHAEAASGALQDLAAGEGI